MVQLGAASMCGIMLGANTRCMRACISGALHAALAYTLCDTDLLDMEAPILQGHASEKRVVHDLRCSKGRQDLTGPI